MWIIAAAAAATGWTIAADVVQPRFAAPEPTSLTAPALVPNDPSFAAQWALQNTGQSGGTPGADVDAVRAWDLTTGDASVVVAIIDTGIDLTHPDLAANLYVNAAETPANGFDDDGNGFVDDVHGWNFVAGNNDVHDDQGHGTLMSGACARGNDAVGLAGLCWTVRILPVKCLNSVGAGTTAQLVEGIRYATRMGVRVILAGWGGGAYSQAMADAIAEAGAAGIAFVAVAGGSAQNLDVNPVYPASYTLPNVVAVAASDANDARASFSSWGPVTVDLAAPGVGVLTTLQNGTWGSVSGTGVAASLAAAAFGLLWSRFPPLDGAAAVAHLLAHVDAVPSLMGVVASGGRLNAYLPLLVTPTAAVVPPATVAVAPRLWWSGHRAEWTELGFEIPGAGRVQMDVFDVRGRHLRRLLNGALGAGRRRIVWDERGASGEPVGAGVYVARLRTAGAVRTVRMVVPGK